MFQLVQMWQETEIQQQNVNFKPHQRRRVVLFFLQRKRKVFQTSPVSILEVEYVVD